MPRSLRKIIAYFLFAILALVQAGPAHVQELETRLALVIGNAHYGSMPVTTGANDAGLVAQTLQTAGFDVTAGADLDLDALRHAFRDFLDKAQQAGPGSVLFVYVAGRAVQYAGDNFFLPTDAVIARDADVPLAALRLSDYTQALAALPAKARIFVVDGARAVDPAMRGKLASGLALVDAAPNSLEAFNAAPGTIAPDEPGPYGAYARALVEMMQLGLPVNDVFARTRLRVNELTAGAVVPWDVSRIDTPFSFFLPQQNAPALPSLSSYDSRPLRTFAPAEAYEIVVERDSIRAFEDYLVAFPNDPLAPRVRALLAARREALSWRRAYAANTPDAYWSYMRRYPRGPHYWDARRRLTMLSAALEPPRHFDPYDFGGLPPPPEDEYGIVDRPGMGFDNYGFAPLPFLPAFLLPVQSQEFRHMRPPPAAQRGQVPIPVPVSTPHVRPGKPMGVIAQPNFGQKGQVSPARGAVPGLAKPAYRQRPAAGVAPEAPGPAATGQAIHAEKPGVAAPGATKPVPHAIEPSPKAATTAPRSALSTSQHLESGRPAAVQTKPPVEARPVAKPLPVKPLPVKPLPAKPLPVKPLPARPIQPKLAPAQAAPAQAAPAKIAPPRVIPPKVAPPRAPPVQVAPPRAAPPRAAPPKPAPFQAAKPHVPPKPPVAKPPAGKPAAAKPPGKAEKKPPGE